jgi:signal transduction histidine kinase
VRETRDQQSDFPPERSLATSRDRDLLLQHLARGAGDAPAGADQLGLLELVSDLGHEVDLMGVLLRGLSSHPAGGEHLAALEVELDVLRGILRQATQARPETDVDVGKLARDVVALVGLVLGGDLDVGVTSEAIVRADPVLLRRGLLDLVLHARAAAPGGRVRVGVRVEGSSAIFEVEDDGPRAPSALPAPTLGLEVVRDVARVQGGTLLCSARPSGGTSVTLRLPRVSTDLNGQRT